MKRIAGLAAALVVVAAACSDSPTAPGKNPLIMDGSLSRTEKVALDKSHGVAPQTRANPSDGKQYVTSTPPFWISTFGTNLLQGDDDSDFILIPFPFSFFGRQWTGVWVGSNGYLTFDAPFTSFVPAPFPTTPPHAIIAAAWDDWDPGDAGAVFFAVVGQAPNRRLVVTWNNVAIFGEGAVPQGNFQIQLLERLNVILLSYNGLTRTTGHWGTPVLAGIASGGFSGFGGFPGQITVASGAQIPALNGRTVCLINLGGAYRVYQDLICSLFVF
jgi:hypothetical protein